jgi:hypothetical protein
MKLPKKLRRSNWQLRHDVMREGQRIADRDTRIRQFMKSSGIKPDAIKAFFAELDAQADEPKIQPIKTRVEQVAEAAARAVVAMVRPTWTSWR